MGLTHLIASIILIVFIPACLADPKDICPPSDLTTPCECSSFWGRVCVKCDRITGNEVIMDVLNKTSDYSYELFWLLRSSVQYIPASAFQIKKIAILAISYTTMNSLFDKPPKTKDLLEIEFRSLKLTRSIQWDLFTGMSNLKILTIFESPLRDIDKQFIQYAPKSLEKITIHGSSISKLPDKAFEAMTSLMEIYMDFGKIKELKRNMFPSPAKIKQISFGNQRIESLPEDIFKDMPDLLEVRLHGNHISQIPEFKGINVNGMFMIRLDNNPIKCNCSIRWIVSMDLKDYFSGKCEEPKHMHGKKLYDLTSNDFQHCAPR